MENPISYRVIEEVFYYLYNRKPTHYILLGFNRNVEYGKEFDRYSEIVKICNTLIDRYYDLNIKIEEISMCDQRIKEEINNFINYHEPTLYLGNNRWINIDHCNIKNISLSSKLGKSIYDIAVELNLLHCLNIVALHKDDYLLEGDPRKATPYPPIFRTRDFSKNILDDTFTLESKNWISGREWLQSNNLIS